MLQQRAVCEVIALVTFVCMSCSGCRQGQRDRKDNLTLRVLVGVLMAVDRHVNLVLCHTEDFRAKFTRLNVDCGFNA
eukprot:4974321-Amphidinium_carterae.2